jgi:hypothetical protein
MGIHALQFSTVVRNVYIIFYGSTEFLKPPASGGSRRPGLLAAY